MSRLLITLLMMLVSTTIYAEVCKDGDAPKVVKKLEDYEIIATNDSTIPTAQAFEGQQLTYSIEYHVKNANNKVSVNGKTGSVLVKATKNDDFDVSVTAKNSCGSTSAKFNVVIDEEE